MSCLYFCCLSGILTKKSLAVNKGVHNNTCIVSSTKSLNCTELQGLGFFSFTPIKR